MALKWPEMPSKVNFGHPKWPINLKWPEMRSKVIFRHPKWPPEKNNSVSIWNGQNCDRWWISEIQNFELIWNGQKCDRKWFLNIQNGHRQTFCKTNFTKIKKNKKIAYRSEMARNAIESEFRTSKMGAGGHFVHFYYLLCYYFLRHPTVRHNNVISLWCMGVMIPLIQKTRSRCDIWEWWFHWSRRRRDLVWLIEIDRPWSVFVWI